MLYVIIARCAILDDIYAMLPIVCVGLYIDLYIRINIKTDFLKKLRDISTELFTYSFISGDICRNYFPLLEWIMENMASSCTIKSANVLSRFDVKGTDIKFL